MFTVFALFFAAGCALLLVLTFTVYRTGIVHKTRDAAGHLKQRQSLAGAATMIAVFVLITAFFLVFQETTLPAGAGLVEHIAYTFALIMLLVLFDSFFIDLLLIGRIRPPFLHIPEETTMQSMKVHVKKTFILGWVFIVPIVLISSIVSYYII
jgi:hypothetical protein